MAKIQHLYEGVGDPNENPELELTGEAVGNHLYSDLDNSSVWMSLTKAGGERAVHNRWIRIDQGDGPDLTINALIEVGQIGTYEFGQEDVETQHGDLVKISWKNYQGIYTIDVFFDVKPPRMFGGGGYSSRRLTVSLGDETFEGEYSGSTGGGVQDHIDIDSSIYDALPRSGELAVKVEYW